MEAVSGRSHARGWVVFVVATALFVIGFALVSQGRVPSPSRFVLLVLVFVRHAIPVVAWLAAAAGFGWAVSKWFSSCDGVVRVVLGVGVLAMFDWLLGTAGWMRIEAVWGLTILGWLLLTVSLSRKRAVVHGYNPPPYPLPFREGMIQMGAWLALPGALLLGAACVAPGIIWESELGGYDAMEYHLQLPAEWAAAGWIGPLEHNAYSWLPSMWEAAYTHLAVWGGSPASLRYAVTSDPWAWSISAQLLHASMAILTALCVARIVVRATGNSIAGYAGAAIYLATPWTIVTGSMGYNEQAAMALGAAALAVAMENNWNPRAGLLIGLLCGLAVMVKLTMVGMIAAPIALILLLGPSRVRCLALFSAGFSVAVLPWIIRNGIETGNPVFPMLTGWLGTGPWTAEQAGRWNVAHASVSFNEGVRALFSRERGLLHPQFGYFIGVAVLMSFIYSVRYLRSRPPEWKLSTVIVLPCVFWVLFTHHQARFLIPLVLPASALLGCGLLYGRTRLSPWIPAAIALLVSMLSFMLYFNEVDGAAPQSIGATAFIADRTPHLKLMNSLPPGSRIYSEGFATPFYTTTPIDYRTVWDRSPLGEQLAVSDEAAARWLHDAGYTHVVIDWLMLETWIAPGNYGYDPNVTLEGLDRFARAHLHPIPGQSDDAAVLLYEVR